MHLNTRLDNVEGLLDGLLKRSESPPAPSKENPVSEQELFRRIDQAIEAAELGGKPSFVLAGRPAKATAMPTLFQSKQSLQLLEHPPKRRAHGFDLNIEEPSHIVQGCDARSLQEIGFWNSGALDH